MGLKTSSGLILVFGFNTGAFVVPMLLGGLKVNTLALVIRDQIGTVLNWSVGPALSVVLIVIAHSIIGLPFMMRNTVAALHGIDPSLQEAAKTLGASSIRAFVEVILPLIRGGMSAGMLLVFILPFNEFTWSFFLFTVVVYAEHDLLRDDSVKLVKSLCDQGKDVTEQKVSGVAHILLQRSMRVPIAYRVITDMGKYLSAS